jgi:hypothetical protein
MRIPYVPLVVLALGLVFSPGPAAHAQLPFPFGPEPDLSKRPQCTKDYVQSVKGALEALGKLRTQGPEAIGRVCALIAMGSVWLGRDPVARAKLREILGFDIDLERAETQCRAGQDTVARELTDIVGRLRAELLRCDDTI